MDLYSFSLTLGALGLLVMGFLGVTHGFHGHPSHAARGGHSHPSHAPHGGARGAATHHAGQAHVAQRVVLSLLSPRVIFSFLLGLGTAGVALRSPLDGPFLLTAAVAGGILLERLVVNPLWNLSFR